jgi:hypothetical protein
VRPIEKLAEELLMVFGKLVDDRIERPTSGQNRSIHTLKLGGGRNMRMSNKETAEKGSRVTREGEHLEDDGAESSIDRVVVDELGVGQAVQVQLALGDELAGRRPQQGHVGDGEDDDHLLGLR